MELDFLYFMILPVGLTILLIRGTKKRCKANGIDFKEYVKSNLSNYTNKLVLSIFLGIIVLSTIVSVYECIANKAHLFQRNGFTYSWVESLLMMPIILLVPIAVCFLGRLSGSINTKGLKEGISKVYNDHEKFSKQMNYQDAVNRYEMASYEYEQAKKSSGSNRNQTMATIAASKARALADMQKYKDKD